MKTPNYFTALYISTLLAIAGLGSVTNAGAQSSNWIGADNGDWFTATNWNPAGIPSNASEVSISNATTASVNGASALANFLFIGSVTGGNNSGGLVVGAGGSLNVTARIDVGWFRSGSLTVRDGGTVSMGTALVSGSSSTGTILVTGTGSVLSVGIDYITGTVPGGSSMVTVEDGGLFTVNNIIDLTQTSNSATFLLNGAAGSRGVLAATSIMKGSGTATIDFNGGILRANANNSDFLNGFASGDVTSNAGGAFIDTNGHNITLTNVIDGTGTLTKQGAGTLTLSAVNTYTGGTAIIGGTLAVAANNNLGGAGSLTFDGGALATTAGFTMNRAVTVNAGGGTFNTTSGTLIASGVVSGAGALIKTGSGTLELAGNNAAFTGGVTLQQGTLEVGHNNGLGAGSLTVNGGTLSTDGSARTINNSILANADFSIYPRGTLVTFSSFRLNGNLDLGGASRTITNPSNFSGGDFGNVRFDGVLSNGGVYFNTLVGNSAAFFSMEGSQSNTYTGLTRIGTGVSLRLQRTANVTSIPGDLTIESDGVAVVDSGEQIANTATVTILGPLGRLQIGAENDVSETIGDLQGDGEVALKDSGNGGTIQLLAGNFSGQITGGVSTNVTSVIKAGPGTLTLSGDSTYTGGTQVLGGTLILDGSLGDTDVIVGVVGTLGGSGTISGALSAASGATIAPGNSPGVLTVGELFLSNTTQLNFELGASSDRIDVVTNLNGLGSTGNLTLDGILNITNSGGFGEGTYRLFNYDGALTNNTLSFGIAPGGYDLTIDTSTANQVNLDAVAVTEQYWDGADTTADNTIDGGSGNWDNTTTNWTNSSGTVNGNWAGLGAIFGGASAGAVTVTENVSYRSLRFTLDGYTLSGAGSLVAVDNTAIIADPGVTATISAQITGAADDSVEIRGGGTVILSGANTYGGGTLLSEGMLLIDNDAALGTGAFIITGATTFGAVDLGSVAIANETTLNGNLTLTARGGDLEFLGPVHLGTTSHTITLVEDSIICMNGPITGSGGLNLQASSSSFQPVLEMCGDSNTYTGLTRVGADVALYIHKDDGAVAINGDLQIDAGGMVIIDDIGSATTQIAATSNLAVDGELLFGGFASDFAQTFASVSGSGFITNGDPGVGTFNLALTIGAGNFSGIIREAAGAGSITLIKEGDGALVLSGANTHSGPTLINGGTLIADGSSALSNTGVTIDGASSVLQISPGVALTNELQIENRGGLDNSGALTGNISIGAGGGFVTNRTGARIDGSISSVGDAEITLFSGSTIAGNLSFGANDSTLTLTGSGNEVLSNAVPGAISGNYGLIKTGSGNWTIDRNLSPVLNTTVVSGSLTIGNGGDLNGLIELDGDLIIAKQAGNYTFGGDVGGSGRVILDGTSNTILVGELLQTGGTYINNGSLTVGNGGYLQGKVVNGGTLYIDREEDLVFEGNISGSGDLIQDGTSNTILVGEQTYTGTTYVNRGGLILGNGADQSSLAGDVIIQEGAYFGGAGTIGGNFTSAGMVSPGYSPGQLNIRGDFTLQSTALLVVEIASASSYDQITIGGKAKLDGTLRVLLLNGYEPEPGTEFDVLNAKSLSGAFDSIEASAMWQIVYGSKSLELVFGGREPYQFYAENSNQFNVAVALENLRTLGSSTDFNLNIRPILDVLSPEELRQAFDAIAPNQSIAFSAALFARSKTWLPQMAARLADIRAGSTGFVSSGFNVRGAADMKDVMAPMPSNKWGVWVDGAGVFNEVAGFARLGDGDGTSAAGTVGADYRLSDNITLGLYTGYVGTWTDFGNGSEVNSNGSRFGIYSTYHTGGFYLNHVIGGEWNSYDWRRRIAFPGIDRTADADTDGTVFETMFSGGYDWKFGNLTAGLFGGLEYTLLFVDGFTEQGAGALNLRIDDQDADSLRTNVGGQVMYELPIGELTFRPSARMAWRHEYLDGSRRVNSTLVGGAGPGFGIVLPATDRRDSVLVNAGFSLGITENLSCYTYYTGDISGQVGDVHAVNAGVRWEF